MLVLTVSTKHIGWGTMMRCLVTSTFPVSTITLRVQLYQVRFKNAFGIVCNMCKLGCRSQSFDNLLSTYFKYLYLKYIIGNIFETASAIFVINIKAISCDDYDECIFLSRCPIKKEAYNAMTLEISQLHEYIANNRAKRQYFCY